MSDDSALPRVLRMALRRWQQARISTVVLEPTSRANFAPYETTKFVLPLTNIDLQSCALQVDMTVSAGATATLESQKFYIAQLIRAVRLRIGGVQIGLQQCEDFGLAHTIRRRFAESSSLDEKSNGVYEYCNFDAVDTLGSTTGTFLTDILGDLIGNRNVRILPCALLRSVELEIEWASPQDRIASKAGDAPAFPAGTTFSFAPRLMFHQVEYAGASLEAAIAARLQQGPIEIALSNVSLFQGNTIVNGGEYQFSPSMQSLDYLIVTGRPADITAANYFNTTAGTSAAMLQLFQNGTPLSNRPLSVPQAYFETMAALDGFSNTLVDPKIKDQEEWYATKFALIKRFAHPTTGSDEMRNALYGFSTARMNLPHSVTFSGIGDDGIRPLIIALHSSTWIINPDGTIGTAN